MVDGKLVGDGTWAFFLKVDGDDLTCDTAFATWFGGDNDPQDSGSTACGYSTKWHPQLMGCALPMHGYGVSVLNGSPVPKMPFGLHSDGSTNVDGCFVRVFNPATDKTITVPCIDLGPGKQATTNPAIPHAIDLSQAAFKAIGGSIEQGIVKVRYRILGGAKYVKTP